MAETKKLKQNRTNTLKQPTNFNDEPISIEDLVKLNAIFKRFIERIGEVAAVLVAHRIYSVAREQKLWRNVDVHCPPVASHHANMTASTMYPHNNSMVRALRLVTLLPPAPQGRAPVTPPDGP